MIISDSSFSNDDVEIVVSSEKKEYQMESIPLHTTSSELVLDSKARITELTGTLESSVNGKQNIKIKRMQVGEVIGAGTLYLKNGSRVTLETSSGRQVLETKQNESVIYNVLILKDT